MYSTSELDELFQILNLIEKDLNLKGLEPHWSNTTLSTVLYLAPNLISIQVLNKSLSIEQVCIHILVKFPISQQVTKY